MTVIDPIALGKKLKVEASADQTTVNATAGVVSNKCPGCNKKMLPMVVSTRFEGDGTGFLPICACTECAIAVPDYSGS